MSPFGIRIAVVLGVSAGLLGCPPAVIEVKKDPVIIEKPKVVAKTIKDIFTDAVVAFDAGKLDEAQVGFGKIAAKFPNNVVIQYNLGVISERQGKLTEAAGYYEVSNKLDPKHTPTLLNLGRVYRQHQAL